MRSVKDGTITGIPWTTPINVTSFWKKKSISHERGQYNSGGSTWASVAVLMVAEEINQMGGKGIFTCGSH